MRPVAIAHSLVGTLDEIDEVHLDLVKTFVEGLWNFPDAIEKCSKPDEAIPDDAPTSIKNALTCDHAKSYTCYLQETENSDLGVLIRWFVPCGKEITLIFDVRFPFMANQAEPA